MSLKIGANNNIPKSMVGAWIGGASNTPKKILNAWIGNASNVPKLFYTAEVVHGEQVFTSSGTFTVPSGVSKIDIFCVGGAGGGCIPSLCVQSGTSTDYESGYGEDGDITQSIYALGGSGYTNSQLQVPVSSGESLIVSVGSAGSEGAGRSVYDGTTERTSYAATRGGTSAVYRGSTSLCSADGGYPASTPNPASTSAPSSSDTTVTKGGNGGSGGRSAGLYAWTYNYNTDAYVSPSWQRKVNGVNGSNGGNATANGTYKNLYNGSTSSWTVSSSNLATGQGSTTKAFGESSGTLYDNFGDGGTVIIRW